MDVRAKGIGSCSRAVGWPAFAVPAGSPQLDATKLEANNVSENMFYYAYCRGEVCIQAKQIEIHT